MNTSSFASSKAFVSVLSIYLNGVASHSQHDELEFLSFEYMISERDGSKGRTRGTYVVDVSAQVE